MLRNLLQKLEVAGGLSRVKFRRLIAERTPELVEYAAARARHLREQHFGKQIFIRGLIEISSYCRNNCYYCGIRRDNCHAERYCLTSEQILACCEFGYPLGFRTFVLQGGEDAWFTDERMLEIIREIKSRFPDCAVTLSLGEKSFASYKAFREAGADRYLLRHETANAEHYAKLHPASQTLESRMRCLKDLRSLGYQVGTGFMVGSPFQTVETLAEDLEFIQSFRPEMIGIGPFIPHHDTRFAAEPPGSLELTLYLLSLLRLMLPGVLLPATTALGSIQPDGRELGVLAGANVIMPNLSPPDVRGKYLLYDNKLNTGAEAAEGLLELRRRLAAIDCEIAVSRGDFSEVSTNK
ncbi:MAG: [FeFe] hydrogenase H-cluster radical SAM maturase HydE [Lentisphaerae bacterium]|nr:[FeFe] hydrogenase H-cluster radical SAM maturase HydE [Lentisphaerota bacterium]